MSYIRILSSTMDSLAEIDDYESLLPIHRWHGIGEIELRINKYKKHVDKLVKGNLIVIGKDLHKVFIIKHREIELNEQGKASENWLIKGLSLKSVIGQRITVPPSHTAYDNKSANAETVMKHYVDRNVINPVDPKRKIHEVVLATNQNRGPQISWNSRFKNLAEEIAEISLTSGLGWDVYLDIDTKKWVFDVQVGKDLTVNQDILPPVIFSPQFESLQSLQYVESELNYKNIAFVAGQGEGVARRVIELGVSEGLARHELFIDARDIAETIEEEGEEPIPRPEVDIIRDLTARGNQQLAEMMQEEYLEGQILTPVKRTEYESRDFFFSPQQPAVEETNRVKVFSSFMYEEDYNLGDIVTVQNKDWGVTLDTRLTEIKEIYEAGGFKLEATFGNNRPTLIQKIKRELAQMSGEVRR